MFVPFLGFNFDHVVKIVSARFTTVKLAFFPFADNLFLEGYL